MALSRRLRFEILRRDNHTCRYCGGQAPDVRLTVDHVIPEALGGTDEPANLVTACQACNAGKTSIAPDSPVVADVRADAFRWADAMREASFFWAINRGDLDRDINRLDEEWNIWSRKNHDGEREAVPRPTDWRDSVERFLKAGTHIDALVHLVGVTMRRRNVAFEQRWTYFCGCAWQHISDLQASAVQYLEGQEACEATSGTD